MSSMLVHAHSGLRWIVLALLVAAIFKSLIKWRSNAPFFEADRKLNFFTMLSTHIQLVLGLVLYFTSEKVSFSADTMKVTLTRFYTVEHFLTMLIAIALITAGYSRSKKATDDAKKFRIAFVYFTIALLLLLAGIPWPFRELGAGWF